MSEPLPQPALTLFPDRIETLRLVLRRFEARDADDVVAHDVDDDECEWLLPRPRPCTPENVNGSLTGSDADARRFIAELCRDGLSCTATAAGTSVGVWAIERKAERKVVGSIELKQPAAVSVAEPKDVKAADLGEAVLSLHRMCGPVDLVTEAVAALIDLAFAPSSRSGYLQVVSQCHPDNAGSVQVMQRNGLMFSHASSDPLLHHYSLCKRKALMIRHGLGDPVKHSRCRHILRSFKIDLLIGKNMKEVSHGVRVKSSQETIEDLGDSLVLLIAMSSGANIVADLKRAKHTALWIISARKIERLFDKEPDAPILFSHGISDNIGYMESMVAQKCSRAQVVPFEGDHYASALFSESTPDKDLVDLVRVALDLPSSQRRHWGRSQQRPLLVDLIKEQFHAKK